MIVSGQMKENLSISQKLNLVENIFQKLKKVESPAYQHYFSRKLSSLSRRVMVLKISSQISYPKSAVIFINRH